MRSEAYRGRPITRRKYQAFARCSRKLLKTAGKLDGTIQMTGGLALGDGLVSAMKEALVREKIAVPIETHPDAIYAGAIGGRCGAHSVGKSCNARGRTANAA